MLNRAPTVRGVWPDALVLRSGWSKAHARPLNDDLPDAALRLERGGADFLRACARRLFDEGAPSVVSVPLHRANRRPWEQAGYRPHRTLSLLERDLGFPVPDPSAPVRPARSEEWPRAAEIDRDSFTLEWRIGRLGLADAAGATPRSRFLVSEVEGSVVGFAIVGVAYQTGYLQRIAVVPAHRGKGLGRALVRASLRWALSRGARTMLLNTQSDNLEAIALYQSERFEVLPERLSLLRATPEDLT